MMKSEVLEKLGMVLFFVLLGPFLITYWFLKLNLYRFTSRHKEVLYGKIILLDEKHGMVIENDEYTKFFYRPSISRLYFEKPLDLSKFFVGQKVSFHRGLRQSNGYMQVVKVKPINNDEVIKVEGYIENLNGLKRAAKLNDHSHINHMGAVCFYVDGVPKSFDFGFFSLEPESVDKVLDSTFGQKCTAALNKKTGEIKEMKILPEMHEDINKDELIKELKDSKNNIH